MPHEISMKEFKRYLTVFLASGFFIVLLTGSAATIYTTDSTDTIGTFRTNVNSSLTNLNSAISSLGTVATSSAVTANYFPTWGSVSALAGTSQLYQNGTSIGIGTTAPSTTLHIVGSAKATGAIYGSSTLDITSTSTFAGAGVFLSSLTLPIAAGGGTVNDSGECTIDSTTKTLNCNTGSSEQVLGMATSTKAWAIESPAVNDKIGGVFFDTSATVRKVACSNVGNGSTATLNFGIGTNRASSTSILFTIGGLACNTSTSTTYSTSFNNASIPANSWVWPTFSAASSTETDITLFYTVDP